MLFVLTADESALKLCSLIGFRSPFSVLCGDSVFHLSPLPPSLNAQKLTRKANDIFVCATFFADPTKFFGCELGAQTQFDTKNDRYIVNGSHEANKLQDMLDGFIRKFVLCPECDNPETDLVTIPQYLGEGGVKHGRATAAQFLPSRSSCSSSMSTPRNKPSATLVRPVDIAACLTPDTNSARSSLKTHQVKFSAASF